MAQGRVTPQFALEKNSPGADVRDCLFCISTPFAKRIRINESAVHGTADFDTLLTFNSI